MNIQCKECLYRVVAPRGQWCYLYKHKLGVCESWISWKAVRDFVLKMFVEAVEKYGRM